MKQLDIGNMFRIQASKSKESEVSIVNPFESSDASPQDLFSAALRIIRGNDSECLPRLFNACSSINQHSLTRAVSCASVLITEYASLIDARNSRGMTPLHLASSMGNKSICLLLLEAGASSNGRDGRQRTPLHEAVRNSQWEIVQLLTSRPWSAHSLPDAEGSTPEDLLSSHQKLSSSTKKDVIQMLRHNHDRVTVLVDITNSRTMNPTEAKMKKRSNSTRDSHENDTEHKLREAHLRHFRDERALQEVSAERDVYKSHCEVLTKQIEELRHQVFDLERKVQDGEHMMSNMMQQMSEEAAARLIEGNLNRQLVQCGLKELSDADEHEAQMTRSEKEAESDEDVMFNLSRMDEDLDATIDEIHHLSLCV
ncbi:ankyrin repeat domain protein [Planoprotostelium fungivorum]|uniref:Ankyrin repeat domain protein n=1 Tax=Planoprotostelium fungivorum TaxID=1890364 RepID=A0A2P6N6D7_9EUKA|nr:ankyrin repeat domain protein [Planoprotostelium fungivorum]